MIMLFLELLGVLIGMQLMLLNGPLGSGEQEPHLKLVSGPVPSHLLLTTGVPNNHQHKVVGTHSQQQQQHQQQVKSGEVPRLPRLKRNGVLLPLQHLLQQPLLLLLLLLKLAQNGASQQQVGMNGDRLVFRVEATKEVQGTRLKEVCSDLSGPCFSKRLIGIGWSYLLRIFSLKCMVTKQAGMYQTPETTFANFVSSSWVGRYLLEFLSHVLATIWCMLCFCPDPKWWWSIVGQKYPSANSCSYSCNYLPTLAKYSLRPSRESGILLNTQQQSVLSDFCLYF